MSESDPTPPAPEDRVQDEGGVEFEKQQVAQEILTRSNSVISAANARGHVTGARIGPNYYTWARGEEVGGSAWAGDEIISHTEYSVSVDEHKGIQLRREIKAYRSLAGQTHSNGYEILDISSDGTFKFTEGSRGRRRYDDERIQKHYGTLDNDRETIRTDEEMSFEQMKGVAEDMLTSLEESLAGDLEQAV